MVALAALLAAAPGAMAQQSAFSSYRRPSANPGASSEIYRVCDRPAVAECQADARLDIELCGPFRGQRACAEEALPRLRACWAATGCF